MKQKRKSRARGEEDDISQQFYAARLGTRNVIIITSLTFFPRVSAQRAGTSQHRSCTLKLEQRGPLLCFKHKHSWELWTTASETATQYFFKRFFWKINAQHKLLTYIRSPCPRRVMEHHVASRSAVRECPPTYTTAHIRWSGRLPGSQAFRNHAYFEKSDHVPVSWGRFPLSIRAQL